MEDGPEVELPPEDRAPAATRRRIPRGVLVALCLAVVVLTIAGWQALSGPGDGAAGPHDPTGTPVPDLRYPTFEGGTSALGELQGSPVVVNFWGSWCEPCIREMPDFEAVHRTYGDRVRFVGLAVNTPEAAGKALARRTGVSYALGFDADTRIVQALGLVNMPSTVLVDASGTVVHVTQKALTAPQLTALIEEHLRPGGA